MTARHLGWSGGMSPENFQILDPLRSLLAHFQTVCAFEMT